MTLLSREITIFQELRNRIAASLDLEVDDPFVLGSAEGECNITECITSIIREARQTEALAEGLKNILAEMRSRHERLDRKAKSLRAIAHWAMCESGIQKISAPDFTAMRSPARAAVVITEPDLQKLPNEFVRITREANKTAIREALQAGARLTFAVLDNGSEVLTIRAK
jgi:hypothetical protein